MVEEGWGKEKKCGANRDLKVSEESNSWTKHKECPLKEL
jgi:hypothetical protein